MVANNRIKTLKWHRDTEQNVIQHNDTQNSIKIDAGCSCLVPLCCHLCGVVYLRHLWVKTFQNINFMKFSLGGDNASAVGPDL
jgi:hypothetical protein